MSRLTLRLPESLHQQLRAHAQVEGVSLNQYIVYALTRQTTSDYTVVTLPPDQVSQQHENYEQRLGELGATSLEEATRVLAEREEVAPEPDLSPTLASRLQSHLTEDTNST